VYDLGLGTIMRTNYFSAQILAKTAFGSVLVATQSFDSPGAGKNPNLTGHKHFLLNAWPHNP